MVEELLSRFKDNSFQNQNSEKNNLLTVTYSNSELYNQELLSKYQKKVESTITLDQSKNGNFLTLFRLEQQCPITQIKKPPVPTEPQKWSFEHLSNFYKKINTICESNALGVLYQHSNYDILRTPEGLRYLGKYRGSTVNRILCGKFHCCRCRELLKQKMKKEIERAITENKLLYHIVITTEGNEKYRDQNDYKKSYKDMAIAWNKIRTLLSQESKKSHRKFSYICLFRAQKNGYVHIHLLTNLKVTKKRLQDISAKYPNTGFIKISERENIASYLSNDFKKDHEFYIPIGQRHYSTSSDITLNINDIQEEELLEEPMHIRLSPKRSVLDQVYEQIEHEYGYPPPLDFILKEVKYGNNSLL